MSGYPSLILPEFASHWARELGCRETSLSRLQGGINNSVYRCGERQQWVIKGYSPVEAGSRDRMQSEVDFLCYAAQVAPGFTPQIIQVDHKRRCVVLEHIDGEAFPEGVHPPQEAVAAAVNFFRRLNDDQKTAKRAIRLDATEGFLRLTEHLDNIQQRLDGMGCDHLPAEAKPQAERLLDSMRNEFEGICESINKQIARNELVDAIEPEERCVSPSDFGFHNAIKTKTRVVFIDFEFSGWDDPAKAIADFILQPRVPLNQGISPLRASLNMGQRQDLDRRYDAFLPILKLKWTCIIMSVLNPDRLTRMTRINPEQPMEALICQRIDTAGSHISRPLSNFTHQS